MAYGLPGEGIAGLDWTPSLNGLTEALTQTLRLITLLGILAILLTHCRHEHLIQGLWVLLQPFVFFGIPTTHIRSSIVRLSLVLESITESKPVPLRDWKQQLTEVFSLDQAPNRGASSEIVLNLQPLLRLDYRVISILALSSIMFIGLAV